MAKILDDWCISLSNTQKYFTTEEQVRKLTGLELREINSYIKGVIIEHPNFNTGEILTTSRILEIENKKVKTKIGLTYDLRRKLKAYLLFEEALKANIPIITNWVIGMDEAKNKKLSANILESDKLSYINKRILDQDLKKMTLTIEGVGEVFVNWDAINFAQEFSLSCAMESSRVFIGKQLNLEANTPELFRQILPIEGTKEFWSPDEKLELNPVYKLLKNKR